ncbi:hypothetical protein F5B20DRAFT_588198 [Whalleya microplaca]|nr:hypothetical protein F5B20DRAFT_588198 [Whalleya microplaca]
MRIETKIIYGKNGSILGKIPIKMDEPLDSGYGSSSSAGAAYSNRRARREPSSSDEAPGAYRRPREVQSEAIAEYRDQALSTRSSRATQDLRRHREARERQRQEARARERREHHEHRSERSLSDSTRAHVHAPEEPQPSCHPKGVRPPGGNSDLKYVVRGFLKRTSRSRREGDEEDGRKVSSDRETFFPNPKITFLIDCPENLVCQICQETPLKMGLTSQSPEPKTPAVLPCGHVACHSCMSMWLDAHENCPFCRKEMVHIGCGHSVQARLIAHDTIGSLPKTLPEGGVISNKCHTCRDKERREYTIDKWQTLAENFKKARREAEKVGTAAADLVLKQAQKAFEGISHGMALDALTARHSSW